MLLSETSSSSTACTPAKRPEKARSPRFASKSGASSTWCDATTRARDAPSPGSDFARAPHPRERPEGETMKHSIDCAQQIRGTYWHAAAILKLELDPIVRVPLEELRFRVGGGAITRRVAGDVGPMETER